MSMKTPILPHDGAKPSSATRRQVLKAAAAGAGLTLMLPASRLLAGPVSITTPKAGAPNLAMGYWTHTNVKATTKIVSDDVVADALAIAPSPGTYELRVLGVNTKVSLTMDAEYAGGAAHHRFWQAWTEQGLLQHSPNSAIRWWADTTKPLPLNISLMGGSASTQVTAQSGTFVLAIGPNAQALPTWSSLALRAKTPGSTDLQLVSRATGAVVTFPYALFSVQQIVA
jgi:hypothetical protein